MKSKLKAWLIAIPLLIFGWAGTNTAAAQKVEVPKETSGCKPSSCRGAKTKFGEAKVITAVRESLVELKADMEKSDSPVFDERSYDIHDIVGDSDEESLAIIAREVRLIEQEFQSKLDRTFKEFDLPTNRARQVKYLAGRIETLQNLL